MDQHNRDGTKRLALTNRLLAVCTGSPRAVRAEIEALLDWASGPCDLRVVDEAVGWAEHLEPPPVLPRMVATTIQGKARDVGIVLDDFRPRS